MLRTAILCLLCGCLILLCLACSVPLYKVAPLPKNVPIATGQTAAIDGLEITATALTKDEQAFARFDANLPLAGIAAVDIKLVNRSDQSIHDLQFELRDTAGRKLSYLKPKDALKQIMDFEGVQMYAIEGKRQTLEQLEAIALPKKITLASQEEKRGVLFFNAKQDVTKITPLTLHVKSGKQTMTLSLP